MALRLRARRRTAPTLTGAETVQVGLATSEHLQGLLLHHKGPGGRGGSQGTLSGLCGTALPCTALRGTATLTKAGHWLGLKGEALPPPLGRGTDQILTHPKSCLPPSPLDPGRQALLQCVQVPETLENRLAPAEERSQDTSSSLNSHGCRQTGLCEYRQTMEPCS